MTKPIHFAWYLISQILLGLKIREINHPRYTDDNLH